MAHYGCLLDSLHNRAQHCGQPPSPDWCEDPSPSPLPSPDLIGSSDLGLGPGLLHP